jgi:hypothetical protein
MTANTELKSQLDEIYALIDLNEQNPFDRDFDASIFDLVDAFLAVHEDSNYINLIVDASTHVDMHRVGCLFTIMLWSTRDEGEKIQAWRVDRFDHGTQRDVEIALCMTEVYPMKDLTAFLEKLNNLKQKYPQTEPLCARWMNSTQNTLRQHEALEQGGLFYVLKQKTLQFFNRYWHVKNRG